MNIKKPIIHFHPYRNQACLTQLQGYTYFKDGCDECLKNSKYECVKIINKVILKRYRNHTYALSHKNLPINVHCTVRNIVRLFLYTVNVVAQCTLDSNF